MLYEHLGARPRIHDTAVIAPTAVISGDVQIGPGCQVLHGAVITAEGPDGPVALTATSVSSVSAEPPLLIFSVSALSSATPAILAADTVVVHLLDSDDLGVAKLASTSGIDRFADTESWSRLVTGEPVFRSVRAWVRCAVIGRMDAGSSTVIAAHALQSQLNRDVEPGEAGDALVYHNRTWHRLGEHSRIR